MVAYLHHNRIYFLNGYIYKGAKKIYRVRKNANKLTIENILACLTIASVLNVDIKSVAKKIRTYKKEKYRLEEIRMEDNKIRIGITQGDINGVGYEVILKTFAEPALTASNKES